MLDMLTCVDEKQINPHVTSLVLQVGGKSNEVTPVRTIVLLLQMTLQRCCSWLLTLKPRRETDVCSLATELISLSLSHLSEEGIIPPTSHGYQSVVALIGILASRPCAPVNLKSSKGSYRVQDVQLTPFQRSSRTVGGLGNTRLDALDVTDVFDLGDGAIAPIAGQCSRESGRRGDGDAEDLHAFQSLAATITVGREWQANVSGRTARSLETLSSRSTGEFHLGNRTRRHGEEDTLVVLL